MQGNRAERLAESIRQEAIELVEYELTDDRIGSVSVTEVEVSPDLKNAKMRLMGLLTPEERFALAEAMLADTLRAVRGAHCAEKDVRLRLMAPAA